MVITKIDRKKQISALLMIDHRNQIAHEYIDYIMQEIYPRIKNYASLMKKIAIDLF